MSTTTISAHDTNETEVKGLRLYSANQIAGATFLGSSTAGGFLLAENFYRLGRTGAAILSVFGGGAVTALVLAIGFNMPQHVPGQVFLFIQAATMFGAAKATQGAELDEHLANGGELAKGWRVVLISLGTAAVIFGILLAMFL